MGKKNKILSLQFEPVINNPKKNCQTVEGLISSARGGLDMVVLPEFFSTGISHNGFKKFAKDEETLNFISRLAKKFDTNICSGSVIEKEGGKFYNSSYVFDRHGEIKAKYRKIHLYSYLGGNEDEVITKGNEPVAVELDFARAGLSICFDIRFPLHFNKLIKAGAEIILCPNAWCAPQKTPKSGLAAAKKLLKGYAVIRANENLCYFAGSSLSGKIGSGLISCANSIIVSPSGKILNEAKSLNDAVYAEIDMDIVRKYKKEFPVFKID